MMCQSLFQLQLQQQEKQPQQSKGLKKIREKGKNQAIIRRGYEMIITVRDARRLFFEFVMMTVASVAVAVAAAAAAACWLAVTAGGGQRSWWCGFHTLN